MHIKFTVVVDRDQHPGVTEEILIPVEPGTLDDEAIELLRRELHRRNGQWADATPDELWGIVEEYRRN